MAPSPRSPLIIVSPSTEAKGLEFHDYSLNLSHAYTRSVLMGGGLPWVIPCAPDENFIAAAVERCDGVMLTGGDDLQPSLYAKEIDATLQKTVGRNDPARDLLEILLIRETLAQKKPLLAICRGQQLLNVALGGDLLVDIPTQRPGSLNHNRLDRKNKVVHDISIAKGSRLGDILGKRTIGVNSSHHQAVGAVADPLQPTATSEDGIIEAMELKSSEKGLSPWLLAVQFHPERLIDESHHFRKLFASFVAACAVSRR